VRPQVVLLGAPTSIASTMVIGPHHAAVTHAGDSSEVGQREHMIRLGIRRKFWSEFLCLGGYLAPPRQVGWGVGGGGGRRDALGRHPSAGPRPRGRSWFGSLPSNGQCGINTPLWLTIALAGHRLVSAGPELHNVG
jgi:hypothetical protein